VSRSPGRIGPEPFEATTSTMPRIATGTMPRRSSGSSGELPTLDASGGMPQRRMCPLVYRLCRIRASFGGSETSSSRVPHGSQDASAFRTTA
jgi:hypothetical protein